MKQFLFSRRSIGLGAMLAAFAALPVQAASASTTATSCPTSLLSQLFRSTGDSNSYTLAPGQSADNFAGTGWTLRGGAKIVKTTLADGKTGTVLDLPAGASATSPRTCAASVARMMTRTVGGAPSGSTSMYFSLAGTSLLGIPLPLLGSQGWTLTVPLNLMPVLSLLGLDDFDFTFVSSAKVGDFQIYNLYLDPRMKA